ncbi:glycosyltransferase [Lactococcus insecticola]|uniref:Glycosyltransferase 2-like domain-containing protein n=1 Tax=Pseudolactococcus insecticola TaxID=2709158 RepID=A0A6A0B3A8_9LACT|nr:glycosyltransferase [Lactococcus insecticola]GFH39800.1 hypothetical protein Hs20B_01980 [Lactococcus insecticola]
MSQKILKELNKKEEYVEYQYDLTDQSWKTNLPTVTITKSEQITENPKVSVVIANFNNEPYLKRMMDSLVNQTIGIENIQVLFCDDRSTDNSLEIVLPYTEKYPNIEIYALDKNTGGAHGPRNVGLQYIRGEHLVILDADDWYDEKGLEILSNLLDQSKSDIVFGGIVRNQNGRMELFSPAYVDQESIDRPVSELPYEFYNWMGPQGNMVRTSVVLEKNLHFVDQRVADDVTFFYQILRMSGTISQTKQLTIYLNRDDDNISLSKAVNETFIVSWLRALSYLKENYTLDEAMERFMSRRLEWLTLDFALRWDTAYGMSYESVEKLANYISSYLGELPFDPSKYFESQPQKLAWQYLMSGQYETLVNFVAWHTLAPIDKRAELIDDLYYFVPDNHELPKIEIPVRIKGKTAAITNGNLVVEFNLYTHERFNRVEIRNNDKPFERITVNAEKVSDNRYQIIVTSEDYAKLSDGINKFFVILNDYDEHMIAIGDLQQYVTRENVLADFEGVAAINAINAIRAIIKPFAGLQSGTFVAFNSQFDKNGGITVNTSKSKEIPKNVFYHSTREIPKGAKKLSISELSDTYHFSTGIYSAAQTIITFHDAQLKYKRDEIKKGDKFKIFAVEFRKDGSISLFTEFGFIEANQDVYTKLKQTKVTIAKTVYSYAKPDFDVNERGRKLSPGSIVEAVDLAFSEDDRPRYLLQDGSYITEKPEFVILATKKIRKPTAKSKLKRRIKRILED